MRNSESPKGSWQSSDGEKQSGELDAELREYAAAKGFPYVRDDDSRRSDFSELPIIANYFYHEEVKKSAKRKNEG